MTPGCPEPASSEPAPAPPEETEPVVAAILAFIHQLPGEIGERARAAYRAGGLRAAAEELWPR